MTPAPWLASARSRHATAVAFAVAAFALRMLRLDAQPLWFDEALSLHIAVARDGMDFIHNTAPLYHLLSRCWCWLVGSEVEGLRSLSAVAGAGFVWVVFLAAHEALGAGAALAAGVVALLSPLHLYYSQEARAYALMLTLLTAALWMLWRVARAPSRGAWLSLVLSSAAALFTHYLAALPLAVACVVIGCLRGDPTRPAPWRTTLLAFAIAGAALLPWLWWWRAHTHFDPADMRWLALLWGQLSVPAALGWSFDMFLLGGQEGHAPIFLKQLSSLPFPDALRTAAELAAGGLVLAAAVQWRAAGRAVLQVAAMTLLPLLSLLLVSVVKPMYCPGRYDVIALPGFVLVLGHAIAAGATAASRPRRAATWLAASVLVAAWVVKDIAYFTAPAGHEPSRLIAEYVIANAQPDETVVVTGETALPVLARLEQRRFVWDAGRCRRAEPPAEFAFRMLPQSLETAPGAVSRYLAAMEDGSIVPDLAQIARDAAGPGLWFVLSTDLRETRSQAAEQLAGSLRAALLAAGFTIVASDNDLGVVRLRRTR